jgi:hypothetical protein
MHATSLIVLKGVSFILIGLIWLAGIIILIGLLIKIHRHSKIVDDLMDAALSTQTEYYITFDEEKHHLHNQPNQNRNSMVILGRLYGSERHTFFYSLKTFCIPPIPFLLPKSGQKTWNTLRKLSRQKFRN